MSFIKCGDHACMQYSTCGRMYVLYISKQSSLSSLLKFLLIIAITDLTLPAAFTQKVLTFRSFFYIDSQVFFFAHFFNLCFNASVVLHIVFCIKPVSNVHQLTFTWVEFQKPSFT